MGCYLTQIAQLDDLFTQKLQQLIVRLRNPPKGCLLQIQLTARYAEFVTIASQLDFNYFYTEQ